jgi:hypothetical protein
MTTDFIFSDATRLAMPGEEPTMNVAETDLARQRAARVARDAEKSKAEGRLK